MYVLLFNFSVCKNIFSKEVVKEKRGTICLLRSCEFHVYTETSYISLGQACITRHIFSLIAKQKLKQCMINVLVTVPSFYKSVVTLLRMEL